MSSDGGGLLLREVDKRIGLTERLARCFVDYRNPSSVEHDVRTLLAQRVYALALGYEDLNDHDELRRDALLSLAAGKVDPTGAGRVRERDRGAALASSSTLNRLELGDPAQAAVHRYKRIVAQPEALDDLLVGLFVGSHGKPPREIWLDLDATDDPLHGMQEGRFFHGYYRCYCYLPLYIFCGDQLLCARLRGADRGSGGGRHRGGGADRRTTAPRVAEDAHRAARRLGVLPRRAHELVRGARRGLPVRPGAQRAPGTRAGVRVARGARGARPNRQGGAALPGLRLPHAQVVDAHAARGGQGGASRQGAEPRASW